MFGSLIRKEAGSPLGRRKISFESTTFTLSTAVRRPSERRGDARILPTLRVAKLSGPPASTWSGSQHLAGGLAAETAQ